MINNKKKLGQNFLSDKFIIDRIISIVHPIKDDIFIEIGAGKGALTANLCKIAKKVIVIEIDKDLVHILKKLKKKYSNLFIINNDILNINLEKIISTKKNVRLIGNLPYNISKKIIIYLIQKRIFFLDSHFMVQKETKDRIISNINCKNYGKLSILCQYFFSIKHILDIYPESFTPLPKVQSSFIRLLHKNKKYELKNFDNLKYVINLAFSKRRKNIKNALKNYISIADLQKADVCLHKRAEQIKVSAYCKIANILHDKYKNLIKKK